MSVFPYNQTAREKAKRNQKTKRSDTREVTVKDVAILLILSGGLGGTTAHLKFLERDTLLRLQVCNRTRRQQTIFIGLICFQGIINFGSAFGLQKKESEGENKTTSKVEE